MMAYLSVQGGAVFGSDGCCAYPLRQIRHTAAVYVPISLWSDFMPREKFKTLTEQMFYVLLALTDECCGMDIMEKVSQITHGRIKVGSGTLYNLLEQFSDEGIIAETKTEGRRRSYILTDKGRTLLEREYDRLVTQAQDYNRVINREVSYGTEEDYAEQMGNMGLAPAY